MNETNMLVPNFLLSVDENDAREGVYETSYVEYPATGLDFLAFNETPCKGEFKTLEFAQNGVDYQRITSGVWMAPSTKYPKMTAGGDFYTVEFKREDLYKALMKYLKRGNADSIKVEHSGTYLDGFTSLEHWIIEDENTKSPVLGLSLTDLGYNPSEIPAGTVMKSTYVENEQFWNEQVMTGKVKGYSIGGLFAFEPDTTVFKKTEWNFKGLFGAMGLNQDGGEVILKDDSVLELKDSVKLNGESVNEGTFSTLNGWTIVVREGSVVDYSFNQVETPVVNAEVPVVETVVEVVDDVANEAIVVDDTHETEVDTTQEQLQEAHVQTETQEVAALSTRMTQLEEKLSLLLGQNALKDETIAKLQGDLVESESKVNKLNSELGKQPIKKQTNTPPVAPNVSVTKTAGRTIRVGNRTM